MVRQGSHTLKLLTEMAGIAPSDGKDTEHLQVLCATKESVDQSIQLLLKDDWKCLLVLKTHTPYYLTIAC